MNKFHRALIAILFGGGVALLLASQCSRRQSALVKYKIELRAQGEKLTWTELGYPRRLETNSSVDRLNAAVAKLPSSPVQPGQLEHMLFIGPGRAQPAWSTVAPPFSVYGGRKALTNSPSWTEFEADMLKAGATLEEIRDLVENSDRYFWLNPEDFLNWPGGSFVQKRTAAQWLAADAISALHTQQLERAQADMHALTRFIQMHKDDATLVNQMIRVAIAGLALTTTWEALEAKGWNEAALAAVQKDWEAVDLLGAIELGLAGERASGEAVIAWMRKASPSNRVKILYLSGSSAGGLKSPRDYYYAYVVTPLWRINSETDELFMLQHSQACLDSIRKLRDGITWPTVTSELTNHYARMDRVLGSKFAEFRYLFCTIGIPNTKRAAQTAVRNETLRRLTVTAIALERYRLHEGRRPTELAALVPGFLTTVPIDPMSGGPLRYRLNTDGTFTLYSVGEDGHDDAGNPAAPVGTNKFDLWSGKDAVWPTAIMPEK